MTKQGASQLYAALPGLKVNIGLASNQDDSVKTAVLNKDGKLSEKTIAKK